MSLIIDEEYQRAGIEVRRQILGPERVRSALEHEDDLIEYHHLFGHECGYANIWSRTGFPPATRSLCVLGMLAAVSPSSETFKVHVLGAVRNGATRVQIRQVLATVSFYLGAGIGTEAITSAQSELGAPDHRDEADAGPNGTLTRQQWLDRGQEMRKRLLGERASTDSQDDALTTFRNLSDAYVFGVLWSDEALAAPARMLVVLSILCADNRISELELYMAGARSLGCTYDDVKEVMLTAFVYCGMPAAEEGFRIARQTFE